jgi:DNA-binding NarL/FixJ family response regulator
MPRKHEDKAGQERPNVLVIECAGGELAALLASDPRVRIDTVRSLPEAVRWLRRARPRMLVLALGDASAQGPEALRAFCEEFSWVPLLIIASPPHDGGVTELIKAGVSSQLFPEDARLLLTSRQLEILELLARGHSYDDIAHALALSVNTVRSHVKALYERLGAATKVEAVRIGIELRLLNAS